MIHINIEIRKPNRFKEFLNKMYNKLEDLMFSVIMKLPERIIPGSLMTWLERYTTKRLNNLKQETIRNTWKNLYLQQAIDEISIKNSHK